MLVAMTIKAVERMGVVAGVDPIDGRMLVLEALRGPESVPRVGAVAALCDSIAGVHAFEVGAGVVPLTADLSVHLVGGEVECGTELRAASRLLKRRSNGAVFEVEVRESADPSHLVAWSVVTYTYTTSSSYSPQPHVGPWPPADLCSTLDDLLPLEVTPDGALKIPVDEVTANAVGILSGGAILMGADLATERAAAAAFGGPATVTDLVTHFLAPGRDGPARITTDVRRVDTASASLHLEFADTSGGGRTMVSVAASARRSAKTEGRP